MKYKWYDGSHCRLDGIIYNKLVFSLEKVQVQIAS